MPMAETTVVVDAAILGDDDEAELSAWLAAEGDLVIVGQPIAEISASKAIVEVSAPVAGRLRHLADVGAILGAGQEFAAIAPA